ncbi:MAG: metal-binding protein [Cycloclasticus sp. symbiont of Poecilosclerida sp. N]|nr:MAG: metal-binding protein [Cycloclasticus sp. symbiont of Poecilosclerida sp. N]
MTTLNDFFNSDQLNEEAMYLSETHGFLTSLVILPGTLSSEQILNIILDDNTANTAIKQEINELRQSIERSLLNGDFPDTYNDALTLWAAGFMQGVFSQQDLWFESHPEEVAELTLPILTCSELLDDEINQPDEVLDDMADRIPDCVIDLYLLFNSPD